MSDQKDESYSGIFPVVTPEICAQIRQMIEGSKEAIAMFNSLPTMADVQKLSAMGNNEDLDLA